MRVDDVDFLHSLGFFNGDLEGCSEAWYSLVGSVTTINIALQIFITITYPISDWVLAGLFKCINRRGCGGLRKTSSIT
jgi:hypothetical protein